MTAPATPVALIPTAPSAPILAVLTTPTSATPTVFVSATPIAPILSNFSKFPFLLISYSFSVSLLFPCHGFSFFLAFPFFIGLLPTIPSQFEASSSSNTVSDDVVTFLTRFYQPEVNDLGLADFWVSGPPYVDFYGFQVPKDCVSHLVMIYNNHSNFMQEFRLGRSAREHLLKMLGCVLNDIEHNFIDSVFAERILQWRAVIQELISVGFTVEFVLDHLREVAQALFKRRVQPTVDAIDARIKLLKKEVADLEGCREHLLSGISGPSRFGDQSLISELH